MNFGITRSRISLSFPYTFENLNITADEPVFSEYRLINLSPSIFVFPYIFTGFNGKSSETGRIADFPYTSLLLPKIIHGWH